MTMPGTEMMSRGVARIVASPILSSVSIFEAIWIVGMVAMMFPAIIPVVLFYDKVASTQEPHPGIARAAGTPLFIGGYLIVYALLGVSFFVIIDAVGYLRNLLDVGLLSVSGSSAVLIAAGVYQFTRLKSRCLSKCVSPISFFSAHFSSGLSGAIRMGVRHGTYCVGCCWAYMLIMFAMAAMSLPVMAVLAGLIALEKVLVRGTSWFERMVGFGLLVLGIGVAVFPSAFLGLI